MGKSFFASVGAIVGLGLVLSGCGGTKKSTDNTTTCTAGKVRCDGPVIKQCDANGQSEAVKQTCGAGLLCREDDDGSASCDSQACTPGVLLCDGGVATTCMIDSSGPKPGGMDCGEKSLACVAGICVDLSCSKGEQFCKNGDLYLCGDDGKTGTLVQDCNGGTEVCDLELSACRPKVCNPNQATCQGSLARTCNDSGSEWLPDESDCADEGLMCIAGKCNACLPLHRQCEDGDVVECDPSGAGLALAEACDPATQHCEETLSNAYCINDVCVPGEELCAGNLLKTCNDDGSLPLDGEDCGADAWCDKAECVPRTCTTDSNFCQGPDILYCSSEGPPKLIGSCATGLTCRVILGAIEPTSGIANVMCLPKTCTPGGSSCLLNQVGTCADDGESLSEVTQDCAGDDQVCTVDSTCVAAVTDTLGADESAQPAYDGNFIGNVVRVTSDRQLTGLAMWLVFRSSHDLRWVIYEQSGSAFIAKVDKVASVASSTGLLASPPFNYKLQAGKTYAIGVAISGGGSVTYTWDTAPFEHPSFGTLLGQINRPYTSMIAFVDSSSTEGVVQMQVATALP